MTILQMLFAIGALGYLLQRSLRTRSSASAYLNRTLTTPTNNAIWTYSFWVKRGSLGSAQYLLSTQDNNGASASYNGFRFNTTDVIEFFQYTSGYTAQLVTTQVFRDPSSWYHIVLAYDSTQATAANRIKLYINGVQVTAFSTATYPALNAVTYINQARPHYIAAYSNTGTGQATYFDGYQTEINFVDGQALTPTSFGEYNSITGSWQPKAFSGTYGTNGFYLNFKDNTSTTTLGYDYSGNSNNWTATNISLTAGVTYDSMTDVPTLTSITANNYPVLNPLAGLNIGAGNLQVTGSSSGAISDHHFSTIALPTTGKWYCEMSSTAYNASTIVGWFGVMTINGLGAQAGGRFSGLVSRVSGGGGGFVQDDTVILSTNIGALNTVFGLAVDRGANTITLYLNNVAQATTPTLATGVDLFFVYATYTSGTGWVNFGQRPFTYTPPSGYLSLNTYNLADSAVPNGATQFAATTYTGNGGTQSIANTVNGKSFQPDLVWVKGRSVAYNNYLEDSVRGVGKDLSSNATDAEATYNLLTSFNSNGFTAFTNGTYLASNQNGTTYVGWQWKASNAAAVTNTSGSISSQVSANTTAGFSIVTYTGTGASAATVGHGLGVAPKMVIIKQRNAGTYGWVTYHASVGAGSYLTLNGTSAATTDTAMFNNTAPTSSVFTLSSGGNIVITNPNAGTMVAYCFSEIAGYSKFGKYTGNGSSDGPFVYLGFRPKFVLIKSTSTIGSWEMLDSSRNVYNPTGLLLRSNSSAAEVNGTPVNDFLSNGFKPRSANGNQNDSGVTYIYAAFAENPFKNALAR